RAIDTSTFLPTEIQAGNTMIGPADFLFAALYALVSQNETIAVQPKPQLNSIAHLPALPTFNLNGTWVHPAEMRDNYLSDRLRLQCWTLKNA
ncbi:MAG: hypothetical protein WCN92_13875, partial [Eubacteriales bacterium]